MVPSKFEGDQILSQLQCSGMTSVLDLMQQGFPSRTSFNELYNMYKNYLPPELARLDPRLFCKALFKALNLKDNDFKFGVTKVFFRPGKFAEFDQLMKSDPDNLANLIKKVKKWLICSRWRKAEWCALSVIKLKNKILYRRECIIKIQKTVRMFICMKKYGPRIKCICKIKTLQSQLAEMDKILDQLESKDDEKKKAQDSVKQLKQKMALTIDKIKDTKSKLTHLELEKLSDDLFKLCDRDFKMLTTLLAHQKHRVEEEKRLKKIQEEMIRVQKQKEEEDKQKSLAEQQHKQKIEIENRRRIEEEAQKKLQLKQNDSSTLLLQKKKEEELRKQQQQQQEQDKRDHDLAMRLAPEFTNGEVEPIKLIKSSISPSGTSSGSNSSTSSLNGGRNTSISTNNKHDLSKWKYAELRDAINTSCDLELLESCREEFHRRLKVYHAWKSKNKKQDSTTSSGSASSSNGTSSSMNKSNDRTPQSIMANLEDVHLNTSSSSTNYKVGSNEQRFFRIPYARPADQLRDNNNSGNVRKGSWYSHFDGKWIARQMEIYDDAPPVLLLAGIDDMNMCELSLDETGLTTKQHAEITEDEFEQIWIKNGGIKYFNDYSKQVSSKYVISKMQKLK
jgi:myosin VI